VTAMDEVIHLDADNPQPIEFEASGVTDSGGLKEVECEDGSGESVPIDPATVEYSYSMKKNGIEIFAGSGDVVTFTPTEPGVYECTFTASVSRDCPPADLELSPVETKVCKIDLDAKTIQNNLPTGDLDDAMEEAPGAFLPKNDDDDDYDAVNSPDFLQAGAIALESDLMPIVLHPIEPVDCAGEYTLTIPGNVKVWQNADRTGAITGATLFDATVATTLYVEGIATAPGVLQLNWMDATTSLADCDRVNVTVFTWEGPLNVPGHAIYNYTTTGVPGSWQAPTGGVLSVAAGTSCDIKWGAGPVRGHAIYQVNADYTWDLEVNVVEIKLATAVGTNSLFYTNPPVQLTALSVLSTAAPPAMTGNLRIEKIEGPLVNGSRRGPQFLEMGFIQNGIGTQLHGVYSTIGMIRRWGVQDGAWYIDVVAGGTAPWYSTFYTPPNDTTVNNQDFNINDTPQLPGSDSPSLPNPPGVDWLDQVNIEVDFKIYFSVRTLETKNGANLVYTQRSESEWECDMSGSMTYIPGPPAALVWIQTGTGNTGDATHAEVTSGAVVPVTTGISLNNLGAASGWTTELP